MIITVDDVLRHAREFEQMLESYYTMITATTTREGVRLLTDYMSRHQARIAAALAKLPSDRLQRIRSLTIRYEPQAADCRCFEGATLPPDATTAQVLDAAVTFDECLIRLYRQAARQLDDEEALELFEGLIRMEERDEIELKKIKAMDYF